MGQHTDAILFYGYCWDVETSEPWNIGIDGDVDYDATVDDEDWEDRYVKAVGSKATSWAGKNKVVVASGCEVSTHCSGECPMPYVAITASKIVSHRGYVTLVKSLAVLPKWDEQLKDFCSKMGITPPGVPGWWLVSDWG